MPEPSGPRSLQGWQARGCLVGIGLIVLLTLVVVVLTLLSLMPRR
ncbi:MAG TPA: hypothetical protein VMW47_09615 [Verrucomicrobiae bacterium]|nr:hypothetical protein [Verrucomicrobiae bacterium]